MGGLFPFLESVTLDDTGWLMLPVVDSLFGYELCGLYHLRSVKHLAVQRRPLSESEMRALAAALRQLSDLT
jgi:hypothetical protein